MALKRALGELSGIPKNTVGAAAVCDRRLGAGGGHLLFAPSNPTVSEKGYWGVFGWGVEPPALPGGAAML